MRTHAWRLPSALLLGLAGTLPAARAQAPAEAAPVAAAVLSADGTALAWERSGRGPVLVLVASALADKGDSRALASLLAPRFTVVNYDRRGRGGSGDAPAWSLEREVEDLAAVIDAAGGQAFLFGSSSGAVLALEAAARLPERVRGAVLFEPPFVVDDSREPIPADLGARAAALVAEGRRGEAVELFMTSAVGVPPEFVEGMRQSPMWAAMERLAHTLPYDAGLLAGLQGGGPLPAGRWTSATAPILVVDGSHSDAYLRHAVQALAAALPAGSRRTLEGQDHSAPFMAPGTLVPLLTDFLLDGPAAASDPASAQRRH